MALLSALTQDEMTIGIFVMLTLASILSLWRHHSYGSGIKLPLPPGPRKLPILGNTLDMPATDQHIIFSQWAEQYDSDILHLKVAGEDYIILNSYEAVIDLLDKRSAIYSSRPHFTMLQDLKTVLWVVMYISCSSVGWKGDLLFMSSGKALNAHRKLFHQEFHPTNLSIHRIHEKRALGIFLNSLIDTPEEWVGHIKQMIGAIIIGVAYGVQVQPKDDPNIIAASKMYSVLNAALVPGAFFVDVFSILQYIPAWFPGASFKQKAKSWHGIRDATIRPPFMQVKQAMIDGTAKDSFTSRCLTNAEQLDPHPDSDSDPTRLSEEEEMIMQTAGTLYEGGADTGKTALRTFLLAMMCFPEAQRAAQEELDRVLGGKRLPDYQDVDDPHTLPYVRGIILECLRWQTVVPLAVPHLVDTEDTYKGYYIPKGSTILANVWSILRDKKRYGPTASTFDPERWLLRTSTSDEKGSLVQWTLNSEMIQQHDPIPMSFGFGRRVCPGQHMALSTFSINVASLLCCFDIHPPVDDRDHDHRNGNGDRDHLTTMNEIKYVSGITNGPAPFECRIKPRSEEHVALTPSTHRTIPIRVTYALSSKVKERLSTEGVERWSWSLSSSSSRTGEGKGGENTGNGRGKGGVERDMWVVLVGVVGTTRSGWNEFSISPCCRVPACGGVYGVKSRGGAGINPSGAFKIPFQGLRLRGRRAQGELVGCGSDAWDVSEYRRGRPLMVRFWDGDGDSDSNKRNWGEGSGEW
ncbi:cytochrome P450 [Lentinula novae-zelandiae]|nr:cytochrome P450 [Lentinula novae-zelandiae]